MPKEGQIKISNEFKSFLRREKQEGEDFEDTIKRLISVPKPSVPQEKQTKNQYTKEINIPPTEKIEIKEIKSHAQIKQLPYKLPIKT